MKEAKQTIVIVIFRKSNNYLSVLQQMLKLLLSWPNALNKSPPSQSNTISTTVREELQR